MEQLQFQNSFGFTELNKMANLIDYTNYNLQHDNQQCLTYNFLPSRTESVGYTSEKMYPKNQMAKVTLYREMVLVPYSLRSVNYHNNYKK